MRTFAIAAAVLLAAPAGGAAQRLAPRFATLPDPFAQPAPSSAVVAFGHPDDYRWEGVVTGGILGGVGGAVFATGMCSFDSPRPTVQCALTAGLLGLVFGTVVGGGVGGLIGGLIPKDNPSP